MSKTLHTMWYRLYSTQELLWNIICSEHLGSALGISFQCDVPDALNVITKHERHLAGAAANQEGESENRILKVEFFVLLNN